LDEEDELNIIDNYSENIELLTSDDIDDFIIREGIW
jgi:hypothetical protein